MNVKVENKYNAEGRGEIWVVTGLTKDTCPKVGDFIPEEGSNEKPRMIAGIEMRSERWTSIGFIVRK